MITVRRAEASGDRVAFTLDRADGASWDLVHASGDLALRAACEPLRIELEVSARLHAALDTALDVLSACWRSPTC